MYINLICELKSKQNLSIHSKGKLLNNASLDRVFSLTLFHQHEIKLTPPQWSDRPILKSFEEN